MRRICVQLLEAFDVRTSGLDRRLARLEIPVGVVQILSRHRLGLDQIPVPLRRCHRQPGVGVRRREIGLSLDDLLIELGRVDLGEELSRPHVGADVHESSFQISIRARVDRRVGERLHRAGQHDLFLRRAALRRHDAHGREREFLRVIRDDVERPRPRRNAPEREPQGDRHQQHTTDNRS